ncbi:MAG: hypothetical protein ACOZF0_01465 [Thermodesulfobacteriota bacterium]
MKKSTPCADIDGHQINLLFNPIVAGKNDPGRHFQDEPLQVSSFRNRHIFLLQGITNVIGLTNGLQRPMAPSSL